MRLLAAALLLALLAVLPLASAGGGMMMMPPCSQVPNEAEPQEGPYYLYPDIIFIWHETNGYRGLQREDLFCVRESDGKTIWVPADDEGL